MVIDQHPLHLEVCLLTILLIFKFDKRVLQAISSAFVAYNFT